VTKVFQTLAIATAFTLASGGLVRAQQAPAASPKDAEPLLLKVQVVISRYQDEKKVSDHQFGGL
jgi:hypothetical protein